MNANIKKWEVGNAPVTVIMLTLNESHNLPRILENLKGWASQVIILDSYSSDNTVDIALNSGAIVAQKKFDGFGSQWNFAIQLKDISMPWVMKIDPDELLTQELKENIISSCNNEKNYNAFVVKRKLWFMGKPMPIEQKIIRIWRHQKCYFNDVLVNEHPIINGNLLEIEGEIEHHDSPSLEHWFNKQNVYTSYESEILFKKKNLADSPKLFGNKLQRRMWLKRYYFKMPFRYHLLFFYNFFILGAFKAGKVGYIWARLRSEIMRLIQYKLLEAKMYGHMPARFIYLQGKPDPRVDQY